jgi:hypothetical protein
MRYRRTCPECGENDWCCVHETADGKYVLRFADSGCLWNGRVDPLINLNKDMLETYRRLPFAHFDVCQCGLVVS